MIVLSLYASTRRGGEANLARFFGRPAIHVIFYSTRLSREMSTIIHQTTTGGEGANTLEGVEEEEGDEERVRVGNALPLDERGSLAEASASMVFLRAVLPNRNNDQLGRRAASPADDRALEA